MKLVTLMLCNCLLFYSCCNSTETLFSQFLVHEKKKGVLDSRGCKSSSDVGFYIMPNLQWEEVLGKRLRRRGEDIGEIKQFEKYAGFGKQLWRMRIHDSGVTENERNEGDEKSVHVRGEWILRGLWCLPMELLFMVSLIGGVSGGWLVHRVEQ